MRSLGEPAVPLGAAFLVILARLANAALCLVASEVIATSSSATMASLRVTMQCSRRVTSVCLHAITAAVSPVKAFATTSSADEETTATDGDL